MPTRCLWMALLLMLALCLNACGTTPKTVATRIDPATTALSDHFVEKLPAETKTTKIAIAPPVTLVSVPATAPGATVAITQAPTPVSIDVGGRKVSAPGGSSVTVELADTGSPGETVHDRAATAAGPTLRTDGDKGNFDASAPKVDLGAVTNEGIGGGGSKGGGGKATGGDTSSTWQNVVAAIATASSRISFWLATFGILCMLAAVVMIIVEHIVGGATDWALVGILAGAGIACMGFAIVADTHPWVIILLAFLIVVGISGYVLWWKFGKPSPAVLTADAQAELAKLEALLKAK